ncbi:MAG: hypothetical protein NZ870_05260, partial [bacterium]|nr:hypothetical protein [bacterium]
MKKNRRCVKTRGAFLFWKYFEVNKKKRKRGDFMLKRIINILQKFLINDTNSVDSLETFLSKFSLKLYQSQVDMLSFLLSSSSQKKAIQAPTGSGKTLAYLIYSLYKFFTRNIDHIIISTYS